MKSIAQQCHVYASKKAVDLVGGDKMFTGVNFTLEGMQSLLWTRLVGEIHVVAAVCSRSARVYDTQGAAPILTLYQRNKQFDDV